MKAPRPSVSPLLWLVPCGMLLLALAPWPYGFYRLLRVVVCGCLGFLVYRIHERERMAWSMTLSAIAVLLNPILAIHLTREIWAILNVGSAALLAVHYFQWRKASEKEQNHKEILKGH